MNFSDAFVQAYQQGLEQQRKQEKEDQYNKLISLLSDKLSNNNAIITGNNLYNATQSFNASNPEIKAGGYQLQNPNLGPDVQTNSNNNFQFTNPSDSSSGGSRLLSALQGTYETPQQRATLVPSTPQPTPKYDTNSLLQLVSTATKQGIPASTALPLVSSIWGALNNQQQTQLEKDEQDKFLAGIPADKQSIAAAFKAKIPGQYLDKLYPKTDNPMVVAPGSGIYEPKTQKYTQLGQKDYGPVANGSWVPIGPNGQYIQIGNDKDQFKNYGGISLNDAGAVDKFLTALGNQESSGNYNLTNPKTGAIGKYQILPSNWPSWSQEAGLGPNAQPTPENQEAVGKFKAIQYFKQFGNWGDVAKAWYAGPGEVTNPSFNHNAPQGEYPSVNSYVKSVLSGFGNTVASENKDNGKYWDIPGVGKMTALQGIDLYKSSLPKQTQYVDDMTGQVKVRQDPGQPEIVRLLKPYVEKLSANQPVDQNAIMKQAYVGISKAINDGKTRAQIEQMVRDDAETFKQSGIDPEQIISGIEWPEKMQNKPNGQGMFSSGGYTGNEYLGF